MNLKKIMIGIIAVLSFAANGITLLADTKIRAAYFPNMTHAQALVGKAQGTYQKAVGERNKIEWKEFNAGSAEIEAFMAGVVDIGFIGPGPAVNGFVKTRGELQIISGAANAGAVLVTRRDLKLKKPAELTGKKVAVPQFGNTQDLTLRYVIHGAGLKETTKGGTVEIVQAENSDIKTLLDNKNIDAAFVPEPWGTRLVKEVGANILLDYKEAYRGGDYSVAVIIVNKDFLNKNRDIVEKFLGAHIEITDYINSNQAKSKEIINSQIKEATGKSLSKEVIDAAFPKVLITYDPKGRSIEEMAGLSAEAGFLRGKPDLKNLFDLTIINKILKAKGKKEIN